MVEVFGQFITVVVVSEETLQEGQKLENGGDVIRSVPTLTTSLGSGLEPRTTGKKKN